MSEPVKLINIETHKDNRRGNISVIEDAPFKIKRVFFIYDVPTSETRGGHAHKTCHQFFIAVCGAVLVNIVGGAHYLLDCPDTGLYVPPLHFVRLTFLTEDTTLMVLASEKYSEGDYIIGEDNGTYKIS